MSATTPGISLSGVQFVFLDRDGVINRKLPEGQFVSRIDDIELLPGAAEAIARMNRSGRTVIVVTNQRGIALGLYTEDALAEMHQALKKQLADAGARVDAIYYCPHDRGQCECRKPKTGLFLRAFEDFPDANAEKSVMIGDSLPDIEAGLALGMRTVFLAGHRETQKAGADRAAAMATLTAGSLIEFVQQYLV